MAGRGPSGPTLKPKRLAAFREDKIVVDTKVVERLAMVETQVRATSKWSNDVDKSWKECDKHYTSELESLRQSVVTLLDTQGEADDDSDGPWEQKVKLFSDRNKLVASIRFGGVNSKGKTLRSNEFMFKGCSYWTTPGHVAKWKGEDQELLLQMLADKRMALD